MLHHRRRESRAHASLPPGLRGQRGKRHQSMNSNGNISRQALPGGHGSALLLLVFAAAAFAAPKTPATTKPKQPERRRTEIVIPVGAALPTALVPNKPGSMEKVTGRLEAVIKAGPLGPVTALTFSPDGKYLLVGT